MAASCVRVDPPSVELHDVKVGQVYKTRIKVSNVGKTMRKIVIKEPAFKLFKFSGSASAEVVSPGLCVCGMLEFTPEEAKEVTDSLLIHVDDRELIEIPLRAFPPACSLQVDPVLDFGCVAANGQVITKNHDITNQGSAPGIFCVAYQGDPSLRLSPLCGVVAAGATQWLKVELRADRPRVIEEKSLVKLQNRSDVTLNIRAKVVDLRLEICDLKGAPQSCLWFGPAYFGTSCVGNLVLRNNSPLACDWVCLLQNTAAETEVGTDLQKSSDAALLERAEKSPALEDVSKIVACVPRQGTLRAYEKTTVAVCFSPVRNTKTTGWKHNSKSRRQDYSLFLLFESVGSRHGFTGRNGDGSVELAVTGSGLPVSLVPRPDRLDFQTCPMGQRVDLLCVLQNLCPQLPVKFRFRKLAHFAPNPSTGEIPPGQSKDVVVSFTAQQQGSFQVNQQIDILGPVVRRCVNDAEDPSKPELCVFHTVSLHLSAVCRSGAAQPAPELNPGIAPPLTDPAGPQPRIQSGDLACCRQMARAAILNANKTRLHMHHRTRSQNAEGAELLALPDDRAASIRPASANKQYRTIFTGVARYRYVDTAYAFTEEEEKKRQQHQQIYADYTKQLRETRQKIKERKQIEMNKDVDIGIVPAQGLVPPTPRIAHLETERVSETGPNYSHAPPETKQVSDVLGAVPSSGQEVAAYHRTLTPLERYQIDIGPLFVDFGEVCVQSECVQKLELINKLPIPVWVQFEVHCPELQGSAPLAHALSPHSHGTLPLTFQSNKPGPFYCAVPFSVNHQHPGQVVVQALVVPLALELSTTHLLLHPHSALLAQSGYRSSVTLRNRHNHPAEFTWRPVVTDRGILFSIRPAAGTVEPLRELDCEVVWHSSFSSPTEGDFDLSVHGGNTQRLHCVAKVGSTEVVPAETHIVFWSVPLNTPSVRTAVLHNTGRRHAFYQVLDVCPLPGMVVGPPEGVVPSRGRAELEIHFKPESVMKFDTSVTIALKNMASIKLRVGGAVEPPNIDISESHFHFNGVYAGSRRAIPFTLSNLSSAPARLTFDLSEHAEFSVQLPRPPAVQAETDPRVIVAEVGGNQTLGCSLVFSPTQVSGHDFDLPLKVNGMRWPTGFLSPPPTPSTSSSPSAGGKRKVIKPLPVNMVKNRIQATALFAPMELSTSRLQFDVTSPSDSYSQTVRLTAVGEDSEFWRAGKRESVTWWFGCDAEAASTRDGEETSLCSVSPSSGSLCPGQSVCVEVGIRPEAVTAGSGPHTLLLPLYLDDKGGVEMQGERGHYPYRELSITVTLQLPRISILPPQILLTPLPLGSCQTATLTLLASGYPSGTRVSAEVDDVLLEDGTKVEPVSVVFPEGNSIPAQQRDRSQPASTQNQEVGATLTCLLSFCSSVPLSICTSITFSDHLRNRVKVRLCATAENCVLTVWPFMALHRSKQWLVLKPGASGVEGILQLCHTPSSTSTQTSSSSSAFERNGSTIKDSASGSFPGSGSMSSQVTTDTGFSPSTDTPNILSVPEFPAVDSDLGAYSQGVLLAVERWFGFFGWPGGLHPISVPHSLRRVPSKFQTHQFGGRTPRIIQNKECRSVRDMLHHLIGQPIPGFPDLPAFSKEVDKLTKQLLQQHEAMLDFLRVQGASLSHVKPAYLLDVQEFKHWRTLQSDSDEEDRGLDYSGVDYESLSKRAWTDVLMQIYKVLVLRRVPPTNLDAVANPENATPLNSQPLSSNLYSPWELHLLSWLNLRYQRARTAAWGTATGGVPSVRWIVNFNLDLADGLVLAAALASYCPYLIRTHFQRMYTGPSSLEQTLHNNIIICQALTTLGLNLDVQATDLSDPNPVQMLMLCVHLYEKLPEYLPQQDLMLSGVLHSTFTMQVLLKNPASDPVKYQALLLGAEADLFSLPDGSAVTIPPKANASLTVQYDCSLLQPTEAVLLLVAASPFGRRGAALAFNVKTNVCGITPLDTVKCKSPCYQHKLLQLPVSNPFSKEGNFRVVLVELQANLMESEKEKANLICQASTMTGSEMAKGQSSDAYGESSDFLSAVRSICLKPGQTDTLNLHYLPFCPGTKYCAVLLVCPEVGDMVYMIKATAELPLPSLITTRPSPNIIATDPLVPILQCKLGQVCEEVLHVPLINVDWERALATWGQYNMSAGEYRRRLLACSLNSSTVRAKTAASKLLKTKAACSPAFDHSKGVEYNVEVSLPEYFTLPSTVTIHTKEDADIPWENPGGGGSVDVPLRFQANSVGQYTCQVVLRSCHDIRVYILEALVTSQGRSLHLDFTSPAHCPVTQDIPLNNQTQLEWKIDAEVCGEGFSGPKVLNVPPGASVCYPLTFNPSVQCVVRGTLSLRSDCDREIHLFTLRGVGEPPRPADHVALRSLVGQTTQTKLDVPNYTQRKLLLKVMTNLSVVSGAPSLELEPGCSSPYTLIASTWKRGKQTGCVSFVEINGDEKETEPGNFLGNYEVYFSLEVICEPAAPVRVIDVQCPIQSSVTIAIPVRNPQEELLMLDVYLEGDDLAGADSVSVLPRETLSYEVTFSPGKVGKTRGGVVFQSKLVGEFWYQLELFALPPPVMSLPQARCQLGNWSKMAIPLVNPTTETLELLIANNNPRNFVLQKDPGRPFIMEPRSSTQLEVCFRPSSIGKGKHTATITCSCPELQEWCVLLSGCGIAPAIEETLTISSLIGSTASITIPITNPAKSPATLRVTLTDEDPSGAGESDQVSPVREKAFSIPLSHTEGIQIRDGGGVDVSVVFSPVSMELQQAWVCVTLNPLISPGRRSSVSQDDTRLEQECPTIRWIYPLRGIPIPVPQ